MIHSKQHRGCRIQDPGTRGYRWWKTADFLHSARSARCAPQETPHSPCMKRSPPKVTRAERSTPSPPPPATTTAKGSGTQDAHNTTFEIPQRSAFSVVVETGVKLGMHSRLCLPPPLPLRSAPETGMGGLSPCVVAWKDEEDPPPPRISGQPHPQPYADPTGGVGSVTAILD